MNDGTPQAQRNLSVLIVDDEVPLLRAYASVLRQAGYVVETAEDGDLARDLVAKRSFDVIVSDITMPGMDGIALLRAVREFDLDVPVVLITGTPSIDTAARAVTHGAFRYLLKPVEPPDLRQVVAEAASLHRLARLKREMLSLAGITDKQLGDRASLEVGFERALGRIWMAFQPIVRSHNGAVFGYEALLRSDEPSLPTPNALFDAAERLGRVHELSRLARSQIARRLKDAPPGTVVFVNLHTLDLGDDALYSRSEPLSAVADRVVLEITERANFDAVVDVPQRVARLRELGYRIAVDDLGAGYAGLTAFAQLVPEVVKIDMSLVRDVSWDLVRQRLVGAVIEASRSLRMLTVAEGVESAEERDTLTALGVELQQGFLFAKPSPDFVVELR